ncbi:hypothetical protein HHL22_18155 [Hymenobacter sp. RP-2-7]|uniref:Uncharacterized protein n=1 Tax=Hymenobacter polaris TaxID=2682546 RepID=A0A7Y0AGX3_9BACT|nr:hypothetical protein [Hymenobacter polaris]NML67132.1 hypothetical protein [Hymenobacter polaris]
MPRPPFTPASVAVQVAARNRRRGRQSKSERVIHRLLLAWVLLLGGLLLLQAYPFPGSAQLSYWLVVAVALGSPVVAGLLLWLAGLGLRSAYHQLRVLRRAAQWTRQEPSDEWLNEEGNRKLR